MKAFIAAILFAAVAAVGAANVLDTQQRAAWDANTTAGARVGDHGHNLVKN